MMRQDESNAPGSMEPSSVARHKAFETKKDCGGDGQFCESEALVQVQEPEVLPPPFKAMTWNVLADGLSEDGFVMQRKNLKVRAGNAWDACIELAQNMTEEPNYAFKCLGGKKQDVPISDVKVDASIGDYIVDQEQFKKLLVDQVKTLIKNDLNSKGVTGKCMVLSAILKVYGAALKEHVDSGFSFKSASELMDRNVFKSQLKGVKKKAFEDDDCAQIGESLTEALELASKHEPFLQLLMNAAANLNDKWDVNGLKEDTNVMLHWGSTALADEQNPYAPNAQGRGMSVLGKIFKEKPDILAVQELDHYRLFQDWLAEKHYATTLQKPQSAIRYNMTIGCAQQKWNDYSIDDRAKCRQEKRFAHASRFASNAQKFNQKKVKCSGDVQCHDNDGVALFWNSKRFKAKQIEIQWMNEDITEGDAGVVGVLLADLMSQHPPACLWVFTTHLSAGNDARSERARIAEVKRFAPWMKQLKNSTTHQEHGCGLVGLLLMMDGNSYQDFANDGIKAEENMFHTLQSQAGLTNYRLGDSVADSSELLDGMNRRDLPSEMAVSVNKIRGIDTVQLSKLGEYQLDRIDYIAVGGRLDRPTVTSLPKYKRDPGNIKQAYDGILPSVENPSDHYPVVAVVQWSGVSGLTLSLFAVHVIMILAVLRVDV
eukprot:CAMPEP_0172719374 /NCGR_PEP_ID=MMETSP1074-20121228/75462_1 /TAXON_ID=2916 /ORGANISM="Ceratium fusus, Strain PA161109" /LENGTH=654 /DNA_ID=CAMNT_0013544717 /DNA_START=127 /DNA_END=2091 /DNA_ORIENTATION=+